MKTRPHEAVRRVVQRAPVYDQFGSERFSQCLLHSSQQSLRFLFFMQVITSPPSRRGLKADTDMEYRPLIGVFNVTRTYSFRNKLEELWPPNMLHCCQPLPSCTDVIASCGTPGASKPTLSFVIFARFCSCISSCCTRITASSTAARGLICYHAQVVRSYLSRLFSSFLLSSGVLVILKV